jgi:hypothetical protein
MAAKGKLPLLALLLLAIACIPAGADNQDNSPVVSAFTLETNPVAGRPITVVLQDMGDTAGHMMRALGDIKREVSRQETVTMVDPDFDSPYFYDWNSAWDLTYPIPDDPIYTRNTGKFLPARPQLLKRFMTEVDSWCNLLQDEVSSVSRSSQTSGNPQIEILNDTTKEISNRCRELQVMIQVPDIDNQAVVKKVIIIRDDLAGINDVRKRLLKSLKQS